MNSGFVKDNIDIILERLEDMHPEAACALDHGNSFQLLIAVVLSAQTTDVSVNKVTPALFERYPDPQALSQADPLDVQEMIRTIGLYKNKSANVVKLSKMLVEVYDGKVPDSFVELVKLPGVGRKTANVVLAEAFGVPRIAVDTHVFRVANRIGLAKADTPDKVEEQLMRLLPEEKWILSHHLLIFHGRKICHARKPDCEARKLKGLCLFEMENKR